MKSAHNVAYGLTKFTKCNILKPFLDCVKLDTVVEQWMVRKEIQKKDDKGLSRNEDTIWIVEIEIGNGCVFGVRE